MSAEFGGIYTSVNTTKIVVVDKEKSKKAPKRKPKTKTPKQPQNPKKYRMLI